MIKKFVVIGDGVLAKIICGFPNVIGYVSPKNLDRIIDSETGKFLGNVNDSHLGIMGIGEPIFKEQAAKIWQKKNRQLGILVHDTAVILGKGSPKIGVGSCICPQAIIDETSEIGKCCMIGPQSVVIHSTVIEDYCHLTMGVKLLAATIKKNAIIGTGAIVLEGRTVGECSIVGAGAIVNKDLPANMKLVQKYNDLVTHRDNFLWTTDRLMKTVKQSHSRRWF